MNKHRILFFLDLISLAGSVFWVVASIFDPSEGFLPVEYIFYLFLPLSILFSAFIHRSASKLSKPYPQKSLAIPVDIWSFCTVLVFISSVLFVLIYSTCESFGCLTGFFPLLSMMFFSAISTLSGLFLFWEDSRILSTTSRVIGLGAFLIFIPIVFYIVSQM